MPSETPTNEPPVFLNEGQNEYMRRFAEHNDTGVPIELATIPLKGKDGEPSAIQRFVDGKYSAMVTGIDETTQDVAQECLRVIGVDEDKWLSSFFAMEKPNQETLYLADCALTPERDVPILLKIADKTVETLRVIGETPKVAFLASPGEPDRTRGDIAGQASAAFSAKHPDIENLGTLTWEEARQQGANTFLFPDLNSGNIGYKIQNDPDGRGWRSMSSPDAHVNILEKNGRVRYLSNYDIHTPTAEELVDITVHAYNLARERMPDDRLPRVSLLSFATHDSAPGTENPELIKKAIALIQERYPELQIATEGPLQWDSATNERIFNKKMKDKGKVFRGEPDVLIFPNRDSANIAYEMLQEPDDGGRVAVGPIFQGLKGGKRVIDLSRGAQEAEIAGAVRIAGRQKIKWLSTTRVESPSSDNAEAA